MIMDSKIEALLNLNKAGEATANNATYLLKDEIYKQDSTNGDISRLPAHNC